MDVMNPLYLQVYNKEGNQEFDAHQWLEAIPVEANRIGFFGPYALSGIVENEGLRQLASLSHSSIHDHLVCLAFFQDEKLVAFSDVPRWHLSSVHEEEAGENIFHVDSLRLMLLNSEVPLHLKIGKKYP